MSYVFLHVKFKRIFSFSPVLDYISIMLHWSCVLRISFVIPLTISFLFDSSLAEWISFFPAEKMMWLTIGWWRKEAKKIFFFFFYAGFLSFGGPIRSGTVWKDGKKSSAVVAGRPDRSLLACYIALFSLPLRSFALLLPSFSLLFSPLFCRSVFLSPRS